MCRHMLTLMGYHLTYLFKDPLFKWNSKFLHFLRVSARSIVFYFCLCYNIYFMNSNDAFNKNGSTSQVCETILSLFEILKYKI
jgi:hypothetical protein